MNNELPIFLSISHLFLWCCLGKSCIIIGWSFAKEEVSHWSRNIFFLGYDSECYLMNCIFFFYNFIPWKTVYLLDITSIKEESGRVCVHRNTILLGKLCNGCRFSASIEFRTASQYYSLCWLVLNSVVVTHWLWLLLVLWSSFWQLETKHRSFASKSKQPSRLIQTAIFFYYYLCWH
jgi:hypothetical protein